MRIAGILASGLTLVRDGLLAAAALPFLVPVWLLPWSMAVTLGRWYGYVLCAAWPLGRRVGLINLRRAYGGALPSRDARRAVWAVFGSLGQSVAEGIQFVPPKNLQAQRATDAWRSMCECEDPALEQRILADPRPKIFVIGHFGSWELAAMIAASRSGQPGAVIVRRVDNPFLDALWRRVRLRHGSASIDKRGAAREAIVRLRQGESVAMVLDENGGPRGVFVPFFGRLASTSKTAAVLSLSTGAPIVVGACVRRPHQPFLFRLALLEPERDQEPGRAIADLTRRIVSTQESWIRDAPLQWRWIHWRWKARPDGTEEQYGRAELRLADDERCAQAARAAGDSA